MRSTQRFRFLTALLAVVAVGVAGFGLTRLQGSASDSASDSVAASPSAVASRGADLAVPDGPTAADLSVARQPMAENGDLDLSANLAADTQGAAAGTGAESGAQQLHLPLSAAQIEAAEAGGQRVAAAPVVPSPAAPAVTAPPATAPPTSTPAPVVTSPGSVAPSTVKPAPASTAKPGASTTVRPTTSPTAAPTTRPPSTAPATTQPAPANGLSEVEQEILRLTNELRTNPTGPLARVKGAPKDCPGLGVDGAGKPTALPALQIDTGVSIQMARAWSQSMDKAGAMSHRANDSQQAIYSQLSISPSAWGENVAWFQGYGDAEAAKIFFEGWRESDGHYCNMMSSQYTRIGVGVFKGAERSWATQNFYG